MSEVAELPSVFDAADMAHEITAPEQFELGEVTDDLLSLGERTERQCDSTRIEEIGRVACAGCPFFDGCMRPQAVAAREMAAQQPDVLEAIDDARSDGIGDMMPEILPLQPKTSYLSELLDENDGIVMAGYEPVQPVRADRPPTAPADEPWWHPEPAAKQTPVRELDEPQESSDETVDISIIELQPPVITPDIPAVEIAPAPMMTPDADVVKPMALESDPAPIATPDIDIDAVMPAPVEADPAPATTSEANSLPIVTPEIATVPIIIPEIATAPIRTIPAIQADPPLPVAPTRESVTELDEPTPAQLPSPAAEDVPLKNRPLEEPPREEVFADEEVSVPAAPEISATPQLDMFEAPVAVPETDNFQALAALETDMFEALVAPITPATDDFEEPAAPESDQPRSVSPIVDETQDVTSEEIEPEPDQAPSLTLPLEVGAPQSHAPEVAPSRSTVLDIAPPKPTMSAVVFSQSAAPDVVASTTPEVVPLLITPPEPGETIEAQELLRDIPEELEPDIADPEEPIPDEPKTAINDSEPTTAAPDAPLVDTAPGASFSGDVSSSPIPDDTLDTPPPDNMPSLLAPDDTPEHAHQPSRLTPASVLSAVQLGIVAVWLAITRGSRNSLTVS